jgi:hypothetical protein
VSGSPALLVALLLPAATGWAIVSCLTGALARSPLAWLGRAAASAMVGLGLSSVAAFAWLLAGGALDGRYVAADALFLLAVGALAGICRRKIWPSADPGGGRSIPGEGAGRVERAFGLAAVAVLATALLAASWSVAQLNAAAPHGQWDAWVIWNHRARFLLRAGTGWRLAFAPELYWTQTPYPLFLPLTVARLWAYAGETTLAPAVLSGIFSVAAPLALAASVSAAAGPVSAAVAGLLLLGTPGFVATGAMQYADVPLAGFLVAGLGALIAADRLEGRGRPGNLALGGFLLGIAGWTKNEGLAAAVACVLARMLYAWQAKGFRAVLADLRIIAIGAALPAAAWLAFRAAVAPSLLPLYLSADQPAGGLMEKLTDRQRWTAALGGVARRLPGLELGFPLVTVALAVALGSRPRALLRSPALLAAALLLAVDVIIFVLTTFDLQWHLGTAADRLVLQVWPILLLGLFSAAGRSVAPATDGPLTTGEARRPGHAGS